MSVVFLCLVAVSLVYCLFIHFICMKKESVQRSALSYGIASVAGAALGIIFFIIYYVRLLTLDNKELAATVADAFSVYVLPALAACLTVLALCLISHYLKQKTASATPYISHLASMLILLWSTICASWSSYDSFELALYIELIGISLALVLMLPTCLCFKRFALRFDDREFMRIRKYGDPKKLERRKEKEHIKETKARIKNGTKKK